MHASIRAILVLLLAINISPAFGKGVLQVMATADKHKYRMSETLSLEVRISNKSRIAQTIYGRLAWGELAGLMLDIHDSEGKKIRSDRLDDNLPVPSTFENERYFVTLGRNHFLGIVRTDLVKDLFPKPGTYLLAVRYQSPVPRGTRPAIKDVISREQGLFQSNPIRITIEP